MRLTSPVSCTSSSSQKQISWKDVKASGYKGCVFDKDNTLTNPYAMCFHPQIKESMRECMEVFDGKVVLLSNSAGLLQVRQSDQIKTRPSTRPQSQSQSSGLTNVNIAQTTTSTPL